MFMKGSPFKKRTWKIVWENEGSWYFSCKSGSYYFINNNNVLYVVQSIITQLNGIWRVRHNYPGNTYPALLHEMQKLVRVDTFFLCLHFQRNTDCNITSLQFTVLKTLEEIFCVVKLNKENQGIPGSSPSGKTLLAEVAWDSFFKGSPWNYGTFDLLIGQTRDEDTP